MRNVVGTFTRFIAHITRNPLGMAGAVVTTVSAVLFLTLFVLDAVGYHGGPVHRDPGVPDHSGAVRARAAADPARPVARAGAPPPRPRVGHGRRGDAARLGPERGSRAAQLPGVPAAVGRQRGDPGRRHLQGRRGHGVDAVLRRLLPLGDGARVHDLQALPARAGQVRRVPHRRGRQLVREVQALGLVAARLGGVQPLPAADRGARPQPAAGARDLRAVPLAEQVRGRPLPGQHALLGGRGQHRDQDGAGGEGGRPPGGPQPGHPLARRPRPRGALPGRREAPDGLRGRDDGEGRHHAPLQGPGRRLEGGAGRERVAHDGLRRLPQPADPRLPRARARAGRGAPRPAHRPRRSPTCAARA